MNKFIGADALARHVRKNESKPGGMRLDYEECGISSNKNDYIDRDMYSWFHSA